jgi:hypothetical protein
MPLKPADQAIKIILGPIIDDTDFKTREESIVYNQAGMEIDIIFEKTDGTVTTTAVTPTSGGVHDWAHTDQGYYELEIPTGTLGDFNNNEEGILHAVGFVTGALPFRSPSYDIIAEDIYNAMVLSSGNLDINLETWKDSAPASLDSNGYVLSNLQRIISDLTATQNLRDQFNLTGISDGTFPATQSQVSNVGSGGTGAINVEASDDNTGGALKSISFVGIETSGDYTNTSGDPLTYHQIDDTAGGIDIVYKFNVGGSYQPINVLFQGYLTGVANDISVQLYDFVGLSWDTRYNLSGQVGSSNVVQPPIAALSKHVGTGVEIGDVYVRFVCTGQTNPTLYVGELLVAAVNTSQSIGYSDGAIWVDTVNGTAGTTLYLNGTADKPVSTWADALTINASLNTNRFRIKGGSSITLTGDSTGFEIIGEGLFTLALGGQNITSTFIHRASISGTGAGSDVIFEDCQFNNSASIPPCYAVQCGIAAASGTPLTGSAAGEYVFVQCSSLVAGSGTPYFDFSGLGSTTGINNRAWTGGANFTLDSDCVLSHEVLAGGGTSITTGGGNAEIRGITRSLTLVLSGSETVQFVGITGPINISGTTTATVNLYGTSSGLPTDTSVTATVNNYTVSNDLITDTILDEVNTGSDHNITNSVGKQLRQASLTSVAHDGTAQGAGANSNQIQLAASASALDGAYDPSMVVITGGTGAGQCRLIYQYDGTTKLATVDRTWKVNPDATSEYQIVPHPGREHVNEGLAQGGSANTITLNTLASSIDDVYAGQFCFIKSGVGEDQLGLITSYNGTTKIAIMHEPWATIPDTTSAYVILPAHIHSDTYLTDLIEGSGTKINDIHDKLPSKDYLRGTDEADGSFDTDDISDLNAAGGGGGDTNNFIIKGTDISIEDA